MLDLNKRTAAFSQLGAIFKALGQKENCSYPLEIQAAIDNFQKESEAVYLKNPWFSPDFVNQAIIGLGIMLEDDKLNQWIASYPDLKKDVANPRQVAIILAGNIPLVGFHDFLSVLISGHQVLVRQSSNDRNLLPAVAKLLIQIEAEFENYIAFSDEIIKGFDAVIATGSNNSSRYFEHYFGKYPHIIRKNRNSLAILNGKESIDEIKALGNDLFQYYGLGCRNVSKLYIPENYDLIPLLKELNNFQTLKNHSPYFNNYEYNKSIYLVNQIPHYDSGFSLFKEDTSLSSPLSVIHFEYYKEINNVLEVVKESKDQIQCIVSNFLIGEGYTPFGKTQSPELWDYADGLDTIDFLQNI